MVRISGVPKGLRFAATPDAMPIAEAEALARALARYEPSDDALKLLADRAADARAAAAGEAAGTAKSAADAAGARAEALDKAGRRLVYEVVLSEAKGGFKFGKTELPDDAKAALDKMITDLQADPKGVFFEIEGHTDSIGNPRSNEVLGMKRAEAVKRYLYETHQVPLHKINVISYGEEKPVSDNKTRQGRAENRRVVLRMLS